MKIERTEKVLKGSIWGAMEKLVQMLLPFIVRTLIIKKLGMDYLGLGSLFNSILQVLNLTELGFGTAAVFAMYEPIAKDKYQTVGAIIIYLKKLFKMIGLIMLGMGLCMIPFLDKIIHGTVPDDINIILLYLIYLGNTVVSYLLFAHKTALLSALQCNDIISKVGFYTNIILYISQILVLIIFSNIYIYTIVIPLSTIFSNFVRSYIVDKKYSNWMIVGTLPEEIKQKIKNNIFPLMSTKLASVLINSADTLVISAFLGLNDVAKYNNYYYIMNSIMGFLIIIYSAMQSGVGNALVVDTKEKIISDFNKFCFINTWIVTICTTCLLCLYQPFIKLWLGKEGLLPFGMVVLFCIYFYANVVQRIVVIYKDAAGIWKEDMLRCYLSCILNITVNIITVRYIGLYGVIGSSVVANIIGLPWMAYILYRTVFKTRVKEFYKHEIIDFCIATIICVISYYTCSLLKDNIFTFGVKILISFILPNILLYFIHHNSDEFKNMVNWIKGFFLHRKERHHD